MNEIVKQFTEGQDYSFATFENFIAIQSADVESKHAYAKITSSDSPQGIYLILNRKLSGIELKNCIEFAIRLHCTYIKKYSLDLMH